MRLVAIDIGGTNARFAIANVADDGTITVDDPITLGTSDHVSLQTAWEAFAERVEGEVPNCASIAIAGPVTGQTVRMTNNSWVLHTGALDEQLGLERVSVLNDFAAIGHAVARAPASQLVHIAGPQNDLPESGVVTIVGPGTGLGVAMVNRFGDGQYNILPTEGGHVDFAPVDSVDDAVLARLRAAHRRVSTERINSGPGIVAIYQTMCELEKRSPTLREDRDIWQAGLAGTDTMAKAAVAHFCMTLGSVCGDYALAHGAKAVVLAGGVGLRLRDQLPSSAFHDRFLFKGRYESLMASLPIKMIVQPEPGLYGAAAAFAQQHGDL